MASTFSTNLAIELIGTGDQAGTWGTTTNSNLGTLIEQAISGYVTQAVATGTDTTITIPNGSTGVARNMYIELTGTGGASTNLIVPSNKKLYFIFNNSTGAVTVKVSGQTGVSVPTGKKMVLVSNGTDIVNGLNYIADFGTNSFSVTNLTASSATITNLIATSGSITNLVSSDASATVLRAGSATLTHLSATSVSITNVSVASATVSSNLTLSGGTANGVAFLNASKVVTAGSALTFDGTQTFSLIATGNAVTNLEGSATNNAIFRFRNGTTGALAGFYGNNSKELIFEANGTTEQMRLTSAGNLGIGTASPGTRLDVQGPFGAESSIRITSPIDGTAGTPAGSFFSFRSGSALRETARIASLNQFANFNGGNLVFSTADTSNVLQTRVTIDSSGNLGIGTASPTNYGATYKTLAVNGSSTGIVDVMQNGTVYGQLSTEANVYKVEAVGASTVLRLVTNSATRATLDSSGNLGLGVTPSAWFGNSKVIQFGSGGSLEGRSNLPNLVQLSANAYIDSSGNTRYLNTAAASSYLQYLGAHSWYTAASGTAGNAISFTQALTLNSNGNLALQGGTTTASGVGITFPASQSASTDANCLDDYEEGAFTPSFIGTTTNPTVTYGEQAGIYTKVGNLVTFRIRLTATGATGGSGDLRVAGLPFAARGVNNAGIVVVQFALGWGTFPLGPNSIAGSSEIILQTTNISNANITVADLTGGSFDKFYVIAGSYFV